MSENIFFFDTYAFFEILDGNPDYDKYKDAIPLTSIFNLAEFNYCLKRTEGKKIADRYTDRYLQYLIEVDIIDIKDAMDFRMNNKKLSMPDAIGYILARKHGVKFLTGDNDFKDMPDVEFVK